MEPTEMTQLVTESARAWQSLGTVSYGPTEAEMKSLQFRRSLYVVRDMKDGETLTPENVRAIRPGFGLPPKYFDVLMGKTIKRDVARGTPLQWDILK
jgi:N-acetylneuraminate synthase